MQTQSPRAAQPQSLAKCRVLAVGEELHFCIDSDRLVSSATLLNHAVTLLGPVWMFVYQFDIKCVFTTT